jgi:hypothetical protein
MALSKNLSQKLIALFRNTVNISGSFAPENNLFYFEESLTMNEAHMAWAFFSWVHTNKKTFGHNLPEVYKEFHKDAGQSYIDTYWAKQDEISANTPDPEGTEIFMLGDTKVKVHKFKPRKK